MEFTTDQTDWDYAIIIEGMAEQFFEEKNDLLPDKDLINVAFISNLF